MMEAFTDADCFEIPVPKFFKSEEKPWENENNVDALLPLIYSAIAIDLLYFEQHGGRSSNG